MTTLAIAGHNWRLDAACRDVDPDLFFPEGKPGSPAVRRQEAEALAVCAGCPVRRECLRAAAPYGIWGGATEGERLPGASLVPSPAYCGTGRHVRSEANTTPAGRCRPCRQENWRLNHPPSGRGRGNSLEPRKRDARGWFIKTANEEIAA